MFDAVLRPFKDRLFEPAVLVLQRRVHPTHITIAGFAVGIAAAVAAALSIWTLALLLWVSNRVLDGLDGAVARAGGTQSDIGGYVDIVLDFIVYAALPFGIAVAADSFPGWRALAVLLGVFYVNAASWMYLSALLEKRNVSATALTSVNMPRGFVEGFETIIGFSLLLIFPDRFVPIAVGLAALTSIGIVQRFVWGIRNL